jgi:hypothetical protein
MAIHRDYFFDDPDATLLATALNFQRSWLNLYEAAILESIQMAQADSIRGTTPLLAYSPITKAGVRPKPRFDKRLKTRHKGPRQRKTKVHPASLSAISPAHPPALPYHPQYRNPSNNGTHHNNGTTLIKALSHNVIYALHSSRFFCSTTNT